MMSKHSWFTSAGLALIAVSLGVGCVKAPQTEFAPGALADPASSAEPLLRDARAFGARGDHLRAEQYLNAALAQGASEQRVLPLLVRTCIADQRYRDAVQYLEDHLRRHPSDRSARFLLASVQFSLGHTELARKGFALVVAADPDQASAQYALAVLLRDDVGDLTEADRHFREYLRVSPQGEHAEEARGSLLVDVQ